jgi:sodium transport system permease protein
VAVVNGGQLPALVAKLEDRGVLRLVSEPLDVEGALQRGELMAVLEVPPDAAGRLAAEEPLTLTLTSSRSGWLPDLAVASIQQELNVYSGEVLAERLARRRLDAGWTRPVRLERKAAAPAGVAAAPLAAGGALPSSMGNVFLLLAITTWAVTGGLSMMAYMTVGEKERRTMESLLITPANRIGIVVGKIALSIIVSAITIGLWSLDSLAYTLLISAMPSGFGAFATPIVSEWRDLGLAIVWPRWR